MVVVRPWRLKRCDRLNTMNPTKQTSTTQAQDASACSDQAAASRPDLVQTWVDFLEPWDWEWFCTFTFRGDVHPEGAEKRFRFLLAKLNRRLFGPRWWVNGASVQWVRALEYQQRGVIHFHALMRLVGDENRFAVMKDWEELAGFARIYPPRNALAVRRYCAKYVVKGGELTVGGGEWGMESCTFSKPGGHEQSPRSLGFFVTDSTPSWWGEVDRGGHAKRCIPISASCELGPRL